MAAIGGQVLTLLDWAKRLDRDGKAQSIVETLSQTNEILTDMVFKPTKDMMTSTETIRTGLPDVYYKLIGQAVPISKSTTAQITEGCAIMEAWSEVDAHSAEITGNVKMARLTEATAFWEAMNNKQATTLVYGSASNPEEYVGFANRYSSLSAGNAQNIIDAGGTGSDNASIYLVGWGNETVHGQFPKGSKAGIDHEPIGLQTISTTESGVEKRRRVYQDHWTWMSGLMLKDWRYVIRIANIDVSALKADGAGAVIKLIDLMLGSTHHLPSRANIKPAFYMNRTLRKMLDIQAKNAANVYLEAGKEEGKLKTSLSDIPLRTCDAMLNTEARVV